MGNKIFAKHILDKLTSGRIRSLAVREIADTSQSDYFRQSCFSRIFTFVIFHRLPISFIFQSCFVDALVLQWLYNGSPLRTRLLDREMQFYFHTDAPLFIKLFR